MPDRAARLLAILAAGMLAGTAAAAKPVVDRVPATIPAAGITITGCCTFVPRTDTRGLISASRARALAAPYLHQPPAAAPATALATLSGSVSILEPPTTLHNPPVWLVTYRLPNPIHVGFGPGGGAPVTHFSVVIDARRGRFVRGFYTA
jgi:hypothetical protein